MNTDILFTFDVIFTGGKRQKASAAEEDVMKVDEDDPTNMGLRPQFGEASE